LIGEGPGGGDEGYRVSRFWNNVVLDNLNGTQTVFAEDLRRVHRHPPAGYPPAEAFETLASDT
jgi:hypothetical protein